MALLMLLLLGLTSAQDTVSLNGMSWVLPVVRNYTYFQGGADWSVCPPQRQQESPIDIQEQPTGEATFQVISENGTRFVPVEFVNKPIGDNYIEMDVAGVEEFFVFAGNAIWNMPERENTQWLQMLNVITPSAHYFNGHQYPLELRLYYATARPDAMLMVMSYVAIWFDESEEDSPFIQSLIDKTDIDVSQVLPASGLLDNYFYYTGSEDRPFPLCYANIGVVLPNYVLGISSRQLDYYNNKYMNNATFAGGRGTNRELQTQIGPVYHFISNQSQPAELPGDEVIVTYL